MSGHAMSVFAPDDGALERAWVFLGEQATHAAAVFSTRERAAAWIAGHELSGILTL